MTGTPAPLPHPGPGEGPHPWCKQAHPLTVVAEGPVKGGDAAVAAVVAVALDAETAVLAGHRRVLAVAGAVDPHAFRLIGFALQVERHPIHPQCPQAPQERTHLVLCCACSGAETQRPVAHGDQGTRGRSGGLSPT